MKYARLDTAALNALRRGGSWVVLTNAGDSVTLQVDGLEAAAASAEPVRESEWLPPGFGASDGANYNPEADAGSKGEWDALLRLMAQTQVVAPSGLGVPVPQSVPGERPSEGLRRRLGLGTREEARARYGQGTATIAEAEAALEKAAAEAWHNGPAGGDKPDPADLEPERLLMQRAHECEAQAKAAEATALHYRAAAAAVRANPPPSEWRAPDRTLKAAHWETTAERAARLGLGR